MGKALFQICMGVLGSIGFAVLFGVVERRILLWVSVGSAIGWAICLSASGGYAGLLLASLFCTAYSEVMARFLKMPAIAMLVPVLIPEIPGGDLYHTMSSLVHGEMSDFALRSEQVFLEAGYIALGIILVSFAVAMIRSVSSVRSRKR